MCGIPGSLAELYRPTPSPPTVTPRQLSYNANTETSDVQGLVKATASLFQSGKYSDLTITCGSEIFKVHRSVVCPRSQFFAAACNGKFKEGISGKIALIEDDPATVQRMLSYLYTLDYEDEIHTNAETTLDKETASTGSQTEEQPPVTENWPAEKLALQRHSRVRNRGQGVFELTPDNYGLREVVTRLSQRHGKEIIDEHWDAILNLIGDCCEICHVD
ncbi:MAG: hypothetical protein M1839_008333 [Geoglossum umbratile]|nr:MAG: hypothetical protein M1839_008333 [Geoglossum umbratile]